MHCYCLNEFYRINLGVISIDFVDKESGHHYKFCNNWLQKYALANSFIYLVALGITGINMIVKFILKCKLILLIVKVTTNYEKRTIQTKEVISSLIKMFVVSFINTVNCSIYYFQAVVILVVNLNLGVDIKYLPIFSGDFKDFSVEWYRIIGATIVRFMPIIIQCITLVLNIITPHFVNFAFLAFDALKRLLDRGCTCDRKRTKALL